ncbi:MAG: head-tail adaptor protein [Bacteroidales bacterium]
MIGEFDTYIEFHRPTRTKSDRGQTIEVFNLLAKDMAKVEYSFDRESGIERVVEATRVTINIHYRGDIEMTDRVKIESKFYRIQNITPDKRWMIQLQAIEIIS